MDQADANFRDRDYWIVENAQYAEPSFRLKKCAALINKVAGTRPCSVLDVGCGPGALRPLLSTNVKYYGIDLAIHNPAPFFRETDIAHEKICFDNMHFDFVTAMGFFEYMGDQQETKLQEIRDILTPDGTFIMSYINFGHFRRKIWPNYNNVRSITEMKRCLNEVFQVNRCFPASHHWRQKQPGKYSLSSLQMRINSQIPILSRQFAVEYFFMCSRKNKLETGR